MSTEQSGRGPVDPNERIRRALHDTLASTPWAQEMFAAASTLQRDFFRYAAHPDTNSGEAQTAYESLLHSLSGMVNVQIREGHENMWVVKDAPAVIVASNHLGIGKVGYVDNKDRAFDFPEDEIEAFPLGMLPGFTVSKLYTGKTQRDIRGEGMGDLGRIHRKLNGIIIPNTEGQGKTAALITDIHRANSDGNRNVFLTFPEGGTSGKRSNGGPYDLEDFRAGTFVMGCKTGIPILPVCQYFDPERGLDLLVLPPLCLGEENLADVAQIQVEVQQAMQARLDAAMTAPAPL